MTARPIRVLIADDHPITADGVQAQLDGHGAITVVGRATSFAALAEALASYPADVVILDLAGMQGSPEAAIQRARREHPGIAFVVFSSLVDMAPELLGAGAAGYVVKADPAAVLRQAVEAAARGGRVLSEAVETYLDATGADPAGARLTGQELTVAKLIAQGCGTEEIAARLAVKPHSVHTYVTRALTKLGYTRRSQLAEWYRRTYETD